jgi:hypothetical protein
MSPYQHLLQLARQQSAAVARGDLETAIRLLQDRAALLEGAAAPGPQDADAIREVLRRDRDLSGAIRERMLDIRARAVQLRHGRRAHNGYHLPPASPLHLLDSTR